MGYYVTNKGYRVMDIWIDGKRYRVLEHRYLLEQHLGRKLTRTEHIHHVNGDKLDNRVENLEVMSQAEHNRHHFKGQLGRGKGRPSWNKGRRTAQPQMTQLICAVCHINFKRNLYAARFRQKHGYATLCSRKCWGAYAQRKRQY